MATNIPPTVPPVGAPPFPSSPEGSPSSPSTSPRSTSPDTPEQDYEQLVNEIEGYLTPLLGKEKAHEIALALGLNAKNTPSTNSPSPTGTQPPVGTPPPENSQLPSATDRKTFHSANVLLLDKGLWERGYVKSKGGLSYDDLKRVANDTGLKPETREAAKYLLENKGEFNKIDTAGAWVGGKSDNIISLAQVKAYVNEDKMFKPTDVRDKAHSSWLNNPESGVANQPRTLEEFKKIAEDESLPERTRIAAQYFADNPERIETVFGKATAPSTTPTTPAPSTTPTTPAPSTTPTTPAPGTTPTTPAPGTTPTTPAPGTPAPSGTEPSRTERTHTLPSLGDPNDANTQKAGKQLLDDPMVELGTLSKEDLQTIANDGRYSEDTRKAAQYLVDNPGEFAKLDRGSGNTPDSYITKSEIRGYFINDPSVPNNVYRASHTLTNDPEVPNGLMSEEDLRKIVDNKDYDQKTRDAAQFFLDNPYAYKQADVNADKYLSKAEMSQFLGSTDKPVTTPATPENTMAALTALQNYSELQKPFKMTDLKNIAADETQSPEIRKQAQYFIDHPEEFHKVDKASTGSTDDSISAEDMTKYLAQNSTDAQTLSNAKTLLNDPKLKDLVDKGMSLEDLDKISKDPQYDQATRDAAKFFVDNPNSFDTVSGTASNGKLDQNISRKDLEDFVAQRQTIAASPEETKKQISQLINDPAVTFPLTEAELHKIADDTGSKYSAETKKAAHYFLDNKDQFDVIDGQNGVKTGSISKEEALKSTTAGLPANEQNTNAMADRLFNNPHIKLPLKYEDLEGIMNDPNRKPETREAARYFHEHKEEFDKVAATKTGFAPIDGITAPPKSEANDNGSIDALLSAYLNGKLYGKDGKPISREQPLTREELQGIAANSQNSKEVREAAYYFYQNGGVQDIQNVRDMQKHVEKRDIQGAEWAASPSWLQGRTARLHEHMQEKHLSSLSRQDLEKIYADPNQDIELRRAAYHLYGLMESHPDYYGDALTEHGLWRMSQGKSYNK